MDMVFSFEGMRAGVIAGRHRFATAVGVVKKGPFFYRKR
jgi:hypothetical protein